MANIVSIDTGTLNPGYNELGDKVSVHDDHIELSGSGYAGFKITHVGGMTANEVNAVLNSVLPETKMVFKSDVTEWSFDLPQQKNVWKDSGGDWNTVAKIPKHLINISSLTPDDLAALNKDNLTITKIVKQAILSKCTENISKDVLNQVL